MANAIYSSEAHQRLVWTIPAPLESAITVSTNPRAPRGPSEPYFGRTLSGGRWHAVSEEPVSFTPQKSITVTFYHLNCWDAQWEEYHEHADPDDEGCEFAPGDDDGPGELLRCCGEERPEAPPPLVVTATKEYVTVHDYVSAVHPWLMEHFDAVSAAVNVWRGGEAPPGQQLFIAAGDLADVDICDEESWQQRHNVVLEIERHTGPPTQAGPRPPDWPRPLGRKPSIGMIRRVNAMLRERGENYQYPEA